MNCLPGKGKTFLTIGQDLFSIDEYVTSQFNYSLHEGRTKPMSEFIPSAAMFYTDLESLDGLTTPTDYGSGIEYADGIVNSLFPDTNIGLQIGMWLNGTYGCSQINQGKMDTNLKVLSDYLQTNQFSAIFLRLGYEFDNPFFGYHDPQVYASAFQYIVQYLRHSLTHTSLSKTKFVWHSWAAPRMEGVSLQDFYPGDSFVDWVGISVFQQLYPSSSNGDNGYVWGGNYADIEEVLDFAKMHTKPTMIAESTPFGGIDKMDNSDSVSTDPWQHWFGRVLSLIETFDIDMWCYINCNWDVQPMWHNVGFGDTLLSSNEYIMEKWQAYIINSEGKQKFLMADMLQNCSESNSFDTISNLDTGMLVSEGTRSFYSIDLSILSIVGICFGTAILLLLLRRKTMQGGTVSEKRPILFSND